MWKEVHKSTEGESARKKRGREEEIKTILPRVEWLNKDDDCNYFGDEIDIPPASKSTEKWRPIMHLVYKGQPLITTPPHLSPVWLHISQHGFIINTFSVKALSQVKFNGAPGK